MKKFLSLFLCLTMLLGSLGLVSCDLFGAKDAESAEEPTDTVEAPAERIKLIENGKAIYTLVYPNGCSSTVRNAMEVLIKKVKDATGVTLLSKSDNIRPGHTRNPEAKEILFGKTNYEETQTLLKGLYADEYYIKALENNKIAFLSSEDSYLLAAVNYYTKHLLTKNLEGEEGNYTLYFEEYHFLAEGADKITNINGRPIQDFSIVYESKRAGYEEVAERLRKVILTHTGYSLPVAKDVEKAETTCEILIGKTNRKLSASCYAKDVELLTYKVVIEGDKLQIVSGGPFSARDCVDNMTITFFATSGKLFNDGIYIEKDLKADPSKIPALSQGADLRIMTSNMLTSWWGEDTDESIPSVALRAEIAAAVLVYYKPDVIGLQEVNSPWIAAMSEYNDLIKEKYGMEYSFLHDSYGGKQNLTAIVYRSDKITVQDSGVKVFSYWNGNYHMRNITWAVMKSGSKTFLFSNTHWAHESEETKNACSAEHAGFINEMKSRYSCPIFSTGDYNAKPQDDNMTSFLNTSSMQSIRLQAQEAGVLINKISGCGAVGGNRGEGNYIDHIMGYGNYTVLRYETVVGSMVNWMSDHSPQFADVALQ